MEPEILILSEVSQKEKKCHMISLMCGIYHVAQMAYLQKKKQTHGHGEQTCGCQVRGGRGRMD